MRDFLFLYTSFDRASPDLKLTAHIRKCSQDIRMIFIFIFYRITDSLAHLRLAYWVLFSSLWCRAESATEDADVAATDC